MANKFWGQLADAFIPGNAYNEHLGRWNPSTTKAGIAGMVADAFVPGGSQMVSGMARNGMLGQGMAQGMFREYIADGMSPSYAQTRQQAKQYVQGVRPEIGNIQTGGNQRPGVGAPQPPEVGGWRSDRPVGGGLAGLINNPGQGANWGTNWQQGAFNRNAQQAQTTMAGRESQAMQGIQDRINAIPTGGHGGYGGAGGFAYSTNPYASSISGDAARDFVGGAGGTGMRMGNTFGGYDVFNEI